MISDMLNAKTVKSYEPVLSTQYGSISNKFYFDKLKGAQEELDFYKSFYGKQYKYKIAERRDSVK